MSVPQRYTPLFLWTAKQLCPSAWCLPTCTPPPTLHSSPPSYHSYIDPQLTVPLIWGSDHAPGLEPLVWALDAMLPPETGQLCPLSPSTGQPKTVLCSFSDSLSFTLHSRGPGSESPLLLHIPCPEGLHSSGEDFTFPAWDRALPARKLPLPGQLEPSLNLSLGSCSQSTSID